MIFVTESDLVSSDYKKVSRFLLNQAQFKACAAISKKNLFNLSYSNTLQDPIWNYVSCGIFDDMKDIENNLSLKLTVLANILSPISKADIPDSCIKKYTDLFDYYIKNVAIEYFKSEVTSKIITPIISTRLDIKNSGSKNSVEILECSDSNAIIEFPKWYDDETGKGFFISSKESDLRIKVKCIKNGNFYVNFKGIDFKDKNWNRVNVCVGYRNIKVMNSDNSLKCTFDDIESVSHDHHQTMYFPVKDNDQFSISLTEKVNILSRDDIIRIMHAVFGDHEAIDSIEV